MIALDVSALGPWTLPVASFEVAMIWFSFPLDVFAYGEGKEHFRVMLAGWFDYRGVDGKITRMDPEKDEWEELVPLLSLRRDKIERAVVSPDSVLCVEFVSGRSVTVGPSEGYAGFEANGPGFKVWGEPSGPQWVTGRTYDQTNGLTGESLWAPKVGMRPGKPGL
jgi:hypothetical protein